VEHLDHCRQRDVFGGHPTTRLAREQHQRGPQAFASEAEAVSRQLIDERILAGQLGHRAKALLVLHGQAALREGPGVLGGAEGDLLLDRFEQVEGLAQPFAGDDATISAGTTYEIMDNTVANMDEDDWVWWETAGDGTFDDNLAMHPVYTPGDDDIANGSVVLTFWVHSFYCDVDVSDEMTLTIVTGCVDAEINNWPENPDDICFGEEMIIDFTGVEVLNAASTEWVIDPTEAGELVDGIFTLSDAYVGDVTITLTALPCASFSQAVSPLSSFFTRSNS
jgi:hypothetical protein